VAGCPFTSDDGVIVLGWVQAVLPTFSVRANQRSEFDILPDLNEVPINMPLFTAETARPNALKSAQVRRERRERLKNPSPPPLLVPQMPDEQARNARVMKQLDKVDEFLEQCKDGETFVKLTAAKERLWNLIYAKAGTLRPRPNRRPIAPMLEPLKRLEPINPTP
jgi:hypothetical protein